MKGWPRLKTGCLVFASASPSDRYIFFHSEDGQRIIASFQKAFEEGLTKEGSGASHAIFLIMDFESRKELDEYIANEPHVVEKVWENIEVEPINVVIANTMG